MNNCYCSIGYISKPEDIELLERMLLYNYPVISKFNYIVAHHNCSNDAIKYLNDYNSIWKKVFGDGVTVLPQIENRGHTFGTMDLDNSVVKYAKTLPIDFIYKSTNDILLDSQILNSNITDEFELYFLQGIGYTGLYPVGFDISLYIKKYLEPMYLYPQTNFYIISKNVDYINDEVYVNTGYNHCRSLPNYSGRVWEVIQDFSSEHLLKQCIIRNKFKYKHLISDDTFTRLLTAVKEYKICDCSHKNIYIEEVGVCHLHDINNPCINI